MDKGFKIFGNVDNIEIIKNKKWIILTSKIKTKHVFVVSIELRKKLVE